MQGGMPKKTLTTENLQALHKGRGNLEKHIENVHLFGVPVVVAVNRSSTETDAEGEMVMAFARRMNVPIALTEVWAKGGKGGETLARELLTVLDKRGAEYHPLYPVGLPIRDKIEIIVKKVYGGDGVVYLPAAERQIDYLESIGLGQTPVCMAKTQYSLTDDPTILGRPTGFKITINEVWGAAGAGFVVARAGDIITMPGLPPQPAAERMAVKDSGANIRLF